MKLNYYSFTKLTSYQISSLSNLTKLTSLSIYIKNIQTILSDNFYNYPYPIPPR